MVHQATWVWQVTSEAKRPRLKLSNDVSFRKETSMMISIHVVLAAVILVAAITAVLSRNLLRAAVALGVGSAALATLFFLLNAPYAGGFELSVGAGLISVLFIIAVSLTESMRGGRGQNRPCTEEGRGQNRPCTEEGRGQNRPCTEEGRGQNRPLYRGGPREL
jgi:uncharacterized MnhB-related membrane protein